MWIINTQHPVHIARDTSTQFVYETAILDESFLQVTTSTVFHMKLFYHIMLLLLVAYMLLIGALPSFLPNVISFTVFFLCQNEVKCLCLVYNNMLDNDYRNVTEFPSDVTASKEVTIHENTASEVVK